MRNLDVSWNGTDMSSDLQDVSGVKYRFYVSNDPSGNDEEMKEVVGNEDNTFTFDQAWNNVFCYGKEVDDFHTLDKQKLFAVAFSATQEIDRIQQAEKTKLEAMESKVAATESKLDSAESKLDSAESKLDTAETEITTLKDKVASLETTITDLVARLTALETA
jgi:peptidoglycan hydrolase CwlO-like protein